MVSPHIYPIYLIFMHRSWQTFSTGIYRDRGFPDKLREQSVHLMRAM